MRNTPQKGRYRWIVFKKGVEWIGAVLEFNIVQVGDDPDLVYAELQEAAKGYIEAAQKNKGFREQAFAPMLNQKTDEEYELLWNKSQEASLEEKVALPKNVFNFGTSNLALV
jgi:hypothetical protein